MRPEKLRGPYGSRRRKRTLASTTKEEDPAPREGRTTDYTQSENHPGVGPRPPTKGPDTHRHIDSHPYRQTDGSHKVLLRQELGHIDSRTQTTTPAREDGGEERRGQGRVSAIVSVVDAGLASLEQTGDVTADGETGVPRHRPEARRTTREESDSGGLGSDLREGRPTQAGRGVEGNTLRCRRTRNAQWDLGRDPGQVCLRPWVPGTFALHLAWGPDPWPKGSGGGGVGKRRSARNGASGCKGFVRGSFTGRPVQGPRAHVRKGGGGGAQGCPRSREVLLARPQWSRLPCPFRLVGSGAEAHAPD